MTDNSSTATLKQNQESFGNVRKSIGSVSTNYGFTGEWEDSTGLLHLRARYYNPEVGRFISRDEWDGDMQLPMSYNRWLYVYANPINLTDPSGNDPFGECIALLTFLAFVDGPLPIGNVTGAIACVAIFGTATFGSFMMSQHAGDFGQAVETVVDNCTWTWENILSLPERDPDPKPQPLPVPTFNPDPVRKTPKPKRCDPGKVISWMATLQPRAANNTKAADAYQIKHAGPTEYWVTGGGQGAWADGIRVTDCYLLDPKYVSKPNISPFVPGSNIAEQVRQSIITKEDKLFARYAAVLRDPFTPVVGLEIITNEYRSQTFWMGLLNKNVVLGGNVVIRP